MEGTGPPSLPAVCALLMLQQHGLCPWAPPAIASHVWPVGSSTGSLNTRKLMGQKKLSGAPMSAAITSKSTSVPGPTPARAAEAQALG